jgi:hypothetical protein
VPEALEGADKVPHEAPLQPAPFNVQLTPLFCASFCAVAVKFWLWPVCNEAVTGFTATAIAGGGAELDSLIVALAALEVSATDVAVAVTDAGEGRFAGAVYVIAAPETLEAADKVPHAAPLQPAPFNVQLTPLFCTSFCTVAVRACECPVCTETVAGLTATAITGGGAVLDSVIDTTALLALSATDVAVAVTVAEEGKFAGAVYIIAAPEALDVAESVPHAAPLHPAPESVHVTPLF